MVHLLQMVYFCWARLFHLLFNVKKVGLINLDGEAFLFAFSPG